MRLRVYILYGFGIITSIGGVSFLAAQYIRFIADPTKLVLLLLVVAFFFCLGRYFEEIGW